MPIPQLLKFKKGWKAHSVGSPDERKGKKKTRVKKLLRIFIKTAIALFILAGIGGVAAFAWFSKDLPDPNRIAQRNVAQSTRIYDRSGEVLLYEIHGDQKRTIVPLEQIPETMREATIAVEDKTFYSHHGFSLRGFVRAIVTDVFRGSKSQGGSTITQQFIKNAILTKEKTYTRKIKELVLAYQIENKFTKDQILQMYLNEIPYGSNAYGVESAANTFFGKSAKDLTLAEGAVLAALPQAPTHYSPYGNNKDELINRQHLILNLMVEQGFLTEDEAAAAKDQTLDFKRRVENIKAPHFVFYVKELLTQKYGERLVEQGGLKVYTSLDITKQVAAEEAIRIGSEKNDRYNASNAALVALDTKTGQILAMVGSKDYFNQDIDGQVNVTLSPRQPGSSFKPIAYATAFGKGYTPDTMLFDLKTNFGNYSPSNYDMTEHGPLTMRKALAGSLNIPAVMTLYLAGINNVLDTAHAMGYTTLNDPERYGLSLVLGGGEVKLLDHVSAFSVFAREGIKHPVNSIVKVEDLNGKVLEEYQESKGEEVLDKKVAQQINSILTDNGARAYIFGAQNRLTLPDRTVAAKTGTTNDFHDAWTLGYTPSIAAGVWVGNNNNEEMSRGADGSVVAAPIWQDFMKRVLTGTPVETFHSPAKENIDKPVLVGEIDTITVKKVDKYTGKLIPESCLNTYPKEYISEKEFKETHNILHYVNKDEPRGPEPNNPNKDPQYARWEAPVQQWAASHGYISPDSVGYEKCDLRSANALPKVTIASPLNNATLNEDNFNITVSATVGPGHRLDHINYYIDTTLVDSVEKSPYSTSYQPINLTNGAHKLTVRVFDEISNNSEASVNFTYSSQGAGVISFNLPAQNTSLSTGAFPVNVNVYAYHPDGVAKIDFYYSNSTVPATPVLIGTASSPVSNSVDFSWATAPASGNIYLYAVLTTRENQQLQSNNVALTIQ